MQRAAMSAPPESRAALNAACRAAYRAAHAALLRDGVSERDAAERVYLATVRAGRGHGFALDPEAEARRRQRSREANDLEPARAACARAWAAMTPAERTAETLRRFKGRRGKGPPKGYLTRASADTVERHTEGSRRGGLASAAKARAAMAERAVRTCAMYYLSHIPVREIARITGLCKRTVYAHLQLPLPPDAKPWPMVDE